ncbi:hypothetical protein BV898_15805 [Hypsibius exemplaris]|uniref:Uncharacterized protein n=1 Tax=Hypsibius exemplaris TaxID=2072580 RepID=A0A9X6RKK2_HYPEX|nr:hypothetical protein BV898_15805 [Hypsibius exemplaris]
MLTIVNRRCTSLLTARLVERWLRQGDQAGLHRKLSDGIKDKKVRKLKGLERYMASLGFPWEGSTDFEWNPATECSWVPSAFRRNGNSLVYGGVNLGLKLVSARNSAANGSKNGGNGDNTGGGGGGGGGGGDGNISDGGSQPRGRGSRKSGKKSGAMHGNNLDCKGIHYFYEIRNETTGIYHKVGIAKQQLCDKARENEETVMIPERVRSQVAELNANSPEGHVYVGLVRRQFNDRQGAYSYETRFVDRGKKFFKARGEDFLPGNRRPYHPNVITKRWPNDPKVDGIRGNFKK